VEAACPGAVEELFRDAEELLLDEYDLAGVAMVMLGDARYEHAGADGTEMLKEGTYGIFGDLLGRKSST